MKKTIFMFMGIFVLLGISGCSNTSAKSAQQSHIQTEHKQAKPIYYQNLKMADQKKVNFNFKADQNDYGYFISAKITNKSNKTIKFNRSKFALQFIDNEVPTALSGALILKPNQTKKLPNLFQKQNINELIQTNCFVTYFHKFKLASTRSMFSTADINNLSQTTNNSSNQTNDTNAQNESNNTNDSQAVSSDNSSSTNTTQLTEAQARQKLADSGYGDTSDLTAEREDGSWDLYNGLGTWIVYDNGDVSYPGNRALDQYLKDHPDANTDNSDSDDVE
ncbi:hypothetical protein ACFQAV_00200 [Companilactobacillus huachuanensis]|uniref:DUF5067 domain-containing protein n=1 Tax=Companilactobacillus huachuanensis TaxID=2559914 RepID=A0ABW1RGM9_9LACO|nr:hypothetical protein [Companilactobacillus huachuanensis]